MAQTATTLSSVLKEAWTDDTLQKQFLADDALLSRIEAVDATMIGKQAQVPIWSDLNSGGYTSVAAGGGAINAASNQTTNQAVYTLVSHLFPINLELSAINQAGGSNLQAVIGAKNLEVEGALSSLRNQCTRQLVTNGDSIVAQCASGGASTTVSLVASPSGTAWGFDAIVRNWLRPGALIDIGTTADTDSLLTAGTVTAVAESATAPTITTATSITTIAGTHFVFIANPNSTTAANPELNGFRNMVNSSGALGGLNPSTAGQEFWQAASRDTSTSILSLDLALNLSRAVKQKSGKRESDVVTGLKQMQNFYSLLQNQVRFSSDKSLDAGGFESVKWNGMAITEYEACLDSDWWCLTMSDFVRINGAIKSPTWLTSVYGGNGQLAWHQGFTDGADALTYPFQVGLRRRNTSAGATALTA